MLFFPCEICTRSHRHTHAHLLIAGLNTFFSPLLFQNFLSIAYPPWQHKVGLHFWLTTTTDTSPPLHPRFNPLPIPLCLPLLFLFCSEWRSKAAVSASFPSLIALLAGGGTRSFSDTDGEGGGSIRGEKMADLCLLLLLSPPTSSQACLRGHWHLGLTLTHSWHWCLSRQHTEGGRERLEFSVGVLSMCECVCVCVYCYQVSLTLSAKLLCL